MIILDSSQKIKKYALAGGGVVVFVALLMIIWTGMKNRISPESSQPLPSAVPSAKNSEQKQKEMLEALQKANSGAPSLSKEESDQKAQDMLEALNAANKK